MATVQFYYRGNSSQGNLSIKFKHSTNIDYRLATKIVSFKKYWFKTDGTKRKLYDFYRLGADAKKHQDYLENIRYIILDRFKDDFNDGVIISKDWLKAVINEVVSITINKDEIERKQKDISEEKLRVAEETERKQKLNLVTSAIQRVIEIEYFNNTNQKNKYNQLLTKIKAFEKHNNRSYLINEVTQGFFDEFTKFLSVDLAHRTTTVQKHCKNLLHALKYQKRTFPKLVELSQALSDVKLIRQSNSEKRIERDEIVVTLSFDELDLIHRTEVPERLMDAKKCILFGSETGQRVSDFKRLTEENIKRIGDLQYWGFWNKKTGADVIIPINDNIRKYIKAYGMPKTDFRSSDEVKLNKEIKEVCRKAKIDSIVKGRVQKVVIIKGEKTKRTITDDYKKYEVITCHTLRRSFATNYYDVLELSEIRQITGHSTNRQLLEYINQSENQTERTKRILDKMNTRVREQSKKSKLKVVNN